MANSDLFAMYIHHGGTLIDLGPTKLYAGGNFVGRFDFDVDRFGFLDVEEEIQKLGYVSWKRLAYKVPRCQVFKCLNDDKDVMEMLSHLSNRCRVMNVYVDGGKMAEGEGVDDEAIADNVAAGVDDDATRVDDVAIGDDDAADENLDLSALIGAYEADGDYFDDGVSENKMQNEKDARDDEPDSEKGANRIEPNCWNSSEEDSDYNPPENQEDTDDEMSEGELFSEDDEYIEARRVSRDKSSRGICDEVLGGVAGDMGFSDYEFSDEDIYSSSTDDEGNRFRPNMRKVVYDPKCDHKYFRVTIGMKFQDGYEAREALKTNAIENGWQIHFRRVVEGEHTCPRAMRNKQVSSSWIAKKYLNVFRIRPEITIKELGKDILERYATHTTIWKLYKAKDKAIEQLRGSVDEHYAKLRSYILELLRVDKEGRFELNVDVGAVFKGIYIGFSALKKGFKMGCRNVIGLDGTFLKTYLGGVLLCAVGKDGNNQMFPIAWAVVEIENEVCWKWFLQILIEELELGDGLGTTFISDQQKGLINAIRELAPFATHRNCVRHVYCNWKKTHNGATLRNIFWRVVKSTYLEEYNLALQELEKEDVAAHADFIARDPTKFCKAFITSSAVCDMILNNVSETFNFFILNARGKHLIHMLEEIRTSLMERQYRKLMDISGNTDVLCPSIRTKLDELQSNSRYCICHPALGGKFEVDLHEDRFVVDVGSRTCTCRKWNITGIPCVHACAAINFLNEDVAGYVHNCYTMTKYLEAYAYGLSPLNGEKMWPRAEGFSVKPPLVKKMPGRPKKKRKRDPLETNPKNQNKLRKLVSMTCQRCFQQGHNSRGCKNATVDKPPSAKGKRGRPKAPEGSLSRARKGKQQASTSTSRPQTDKAVLRQERRKVEQGCGVLVCGSENIYTRMPTQRRAIFVRPPTRSMPLRKCASSSKSSLAEKATQESRN